MLEQTRRVLLTIYMIYEKRARSRYFFPNSRNHWGGSTEQQNGRKEGIEIRGQLILIHNYVESWPFKFVLKLITETLSFLAIYDIYDMYTKVYIKKYTDT